MRVFGRLRITTTKPRAKIPLKMPRERTKTETRPFPLTPRLHLEGVECHQLPEMVRKLVGRGDRRIANATSFGASYDSTPKAAGRVSYRSPSKKIHAKVGDGCAS